MQPPGSRAPAACVPSLEHAHGDGRLARAEQVAGELCRKIAESNALESAQIQAGALVV